MLICPIAHHGSSLELPEDTAEELNKFKKALSAAFATNGQHCVIYERNYKSDHLQIQVSSYLKTILVFYFSGFSYFCIFLFLSLSCFKQ